MDELPALLQDADLRRRFQSEPTTPNELRPAVNVANFFESMGGFVRFGIIDCTIACSLWCGVVAGSWNQLLPMIRLRRTRDPAVWEFFEYLAAICTEFMKEHPSTYPRGEVVRRDAPAPDRTGVGEFCRCRGFRGTAHRSFRTIVWSG